MLPKLKLDGFAVNEPAMSPLPDRGIARLEFDAFDTMLSVPLADPETVGSKTTVNDTA